MFVDKWADKIASELRREDDEETRSSKLTSVVEVPPTSFSKLLEDNEKNISPTNIFITASQAPSPEKTARFSGGSAVIWSKAISREVYHLNLEYFSAWQSRLIVYRQANNIQLSNCIQQIRTKCKCFSKHYTGLLLLLCVYRISQTVENSKLFE